jgi:hypothetical protein
MCGKHQFEMLFVLNYSPVASLAHLHHLEFQQISQIGVNICGGNGVSAHPYVYPTQEKVFIHIGHVQQGYVMQIEWLHNLNHGVVGSFPHLHYLGFHLSLLNLGQHLW